MEGRQNSLTKLPQLSKKKKDKIISIGKKFDQQLKSVQQMEQSSTNVMAKFDFLYGSHRKNYSSKKQLLQEAREQVQEDRIRLKIKQTQAYENNDGEQRQKSLTSRRGSNSQKQLIEKQSLLAKIKLSQTKEFFNKIPKKLSLLQLAGLSGQVNTIETSPGRKKSAVATNIRQKQSLPFYSTQEQRQIEAPYTTLSQSPDKQKIKVRLSNGLTKEISQKTLYYKIENEIQNSAENKESNPQVFSKGELENEKNQQGHSINVDYQFLSRIIDSISHKIPSYRREQMLADLVQNYKLSVIAFNQNYSKPGWLKQKITRQNNLKINKEVTSNLQKHLVCSDQLQFLSIFDLDKKRYLPMLISTQYEVKKLEDFIHFDIFQLITIYSKHKIEPTQKIDAKLILEDEQQNLGVKKMHEQEGANKKQEQIKKIQKDMDPSEHYKASKTVTNLNIDQHLKNKRQKMDLLIYKIELKLESMRDVLYKDIEHVIKLNPRLVGVPYKQYVKTFLTKFSKYLGVVLRSILSHSIYEQLLNLGDFFLNYFQVDFNGVLSACHPDTTFYQCLFKINTPYITPFCKTQILHGPSLIMLEAKLKKMKRKTLKNIYKFLIDSRRCIQNYPQRPLTEGGDGTKSSASKPGGSLSVGLPNRQRIQLQSIYEILQTNLLQPIKKYIESYLSGSQNINGCISNININIHIYGKFDKFVHTIQLLSEGVQKNVVNLYKEYFGFWELYLMERPYIDEMISLFKKINGIRLMQDEMSNLKADLKIIKAFPSVIEHKVVRLDISQVKQQIISTITANMIKIGRASEQVLQQLLSIGLTQTQKAKKLNEISPYSTIAQYINFAKTLNSRGIEKSIERVALNAVVLNQNWNFLESINFSVKHKIMIQYLQSCIWVRMLRKAANANKAKLFVDPQVFSVGVVEKKYKIYHKYMFIVKEIAEVIKLTQIAHWDRYSALAKNIYSELQQISRIATSIGEEEELLRIQYCEQPTVTIPKQQAHNSQSASKGEQIEKVAQEKKKIQLKPRHLQKSGSFKQNFFFFFKEEIYLRNFAKFWDYVLKFKSEVENMSRLTLYEVQGETVLKNLRYGQQLMHQLKIVSVNKRLLGLVEKLYRELEPFLKNQKLIKVLCTGSQNARTRSITQLKQQIFVFIGRKKMEIEQRKRKKEEQRMAKLEEKQQEAVDDQENKEQVKQKANNQKKTGEQVIGQQKKVEAVDQYQFDLATIAKLQQFLKFEQMHITLKQLIETPLPLIDYLPFYQMYCAERRKEQIVSKVKHISHYIKSIEVKTYELIISQSIPSLQTIMIPQSCIDYVEQQNKQMTVIVEQINTNNRLKQSAQLLQIYEQYSKDAQNCSKKLSIFLGSLQKMKKIQLYMGFLFSWFQVILPSLMPASSSILNQYKQTYTQFTAEYDKKLQLLKKLSFSNFFQDRVRISYDDQLLKFDELKSKLYNHPVFGMEALSKSYKTSSFCIYSPENLFEYLSMLPQMLQIEYSQTLDKKIGDLYKNSFKQMSQTKINNLMPMPGLKNSFFCLEYSQKQKIFYVRGDRIWTIHNQCIILSKKKVEQQQLKITSKTQNSQTNRFRQKLFNVEMIQGEGESSEVAPTYTCHFEVLTMLQKIKIMLSDSIQQQVVELLPIIYSMHYNIRDIFQLYITLTHCLFQTVIICLHAVFYMDLLLVWENDYDIQVLRQKIVQCYMSGFEAKQIENYSLIQAIYNCYEQFVALIDCMVRRRLAENDREMEGSSIDAEKIRKKLTIQFFPLVIFQEFQESENIQRNREWMFVQKKNKQDDFVNETHLNPTFTSIMENLGCNVQARQIMEKLQFKQIEKKDQIYIDKLKDSFFAPLYPDKKKANINLKTTKLMVVGHSKYKIDFSYLIVPSLSSHVDMQQPIINATWMLLQSSRHNKILITNCHPNNKIFGRNITHRYIRISKINVDKDLKQLEYRLSAKQKLQAAQRQQKIREQSLSLGAVSSVGQNLRTSMMSNSSALSTPKVTKKSHSLANNNFAKKSAYFLSMSLHELDNEDEQQIITKLKSQQGQLLMEQAKQTMSRVLQQKQNIVCIHVEDDQSLHHVISLLAQHNKIQTGVPTTSQQQNKTKIHPLFYVHSMYLNIEYLKKHPRLQQCLLYLNQGATASSGSVMAIPYSQNKQFSQKPATNKQSAATALLSQVIGKKIPEIQQNNGSSIHENFQTAFIPLPPFLHSNSLLKNYKCLYPYDTSGIATKIYQNVLVSPLSLGQASSPNVCRSPINPKLRQLIQNCIIKYYISRSIQKYLQLSHFEPIIYALHYSAFVVPSGANICKGFNNFTQYIVEHQIYRIMGSVWSILMEEVAKMQVGDVVSNNFQTELDIIDLYHVPLYSMQIHDVLGSIEAVIDSRNYKSKHTKTIKRGVMEKIITLAIMAENLVIGDKTVSSINSIGSAHKQDPLLASLDQYLIHKSKPPQPSSTSSVQFYRNKWFILDLSIDNQTSTFIYQWLCSSFSQQTFVFMNQQVLFWDHNKNLRVSYSKKNQFNNNNNTVTLLSFMLFKLIIIVHPNILNANRSGMKVLQPLPSINLVSNYNPFLQLAFEIPSLLQILKTKNCSTPKIDDILSIFTKIIMHGFDEESTKSQSGKSNLYQQLTPDKLKGILNKLQIMFNQLRKQRLASGLYTEQQIPENQKRDVLMCSIELRQKYKVGYQMMADMQQIEKNLQIQRKDMYKTFVSIFNAVINQNSSSKQISFNPNYLNAQHLKQYIKGIHLSKKLQENMKGQLKIMDQKLIPDIGIDVLVKIFVQAIYSALCISCVTDAQREQLSKQIMSVFSSSTSENTEMESVKKKSTKKGRQKKAVISSSISLNDSNLLGIPILTPTPTNSNEVQHFSLRNFFYNVATDSWLRNYELSSQFLLPSQQNCTLSAHKRALHPAQILRLNPYLNIGVKQSQLKVFCQASSIQYEINPLKNYLDHDIIWTHYHLLYDHFTSFLIFTKNDRNLSTSYENNEFLTKLCQLAQPFEHLTPLKVSMESIRNELCKTSAQYIQREYLKNNYNKFKLARSNDKVSMKSTNFNLLVTFISSAECKIDDVKLAISLLGIGNASHRNLVSQSQIKNEQSLQALVERYLKYKNHSNIGQLLLTLQSSPSFQKNKNKTPNRHHHKEGNADEAKKRQILNSIYQVHLNRIVALNGCRTNFNIFNRVFKIVMQLVPSSSSLLSIFSKDILDLRPKSPICFKGNRYSTQLKAYGIYLESNIDLLLQIQKLIQDASNQQKLLKNQMLMENNTNQNAALASIEQRKYKSELQFGQRIMNYLEKVSNISLKQSAFLQYVPRYLLPKPKKIKTSSLLISEPGMSTNNSFNQLMQLKLMTELSSKFEQAQKSNNEAGIKIEEVPMKQQQIEKQLTNEAFMQKLYHVDYSYSSIFELNEPIIIAKVLDNQKDIGLVDIQSFITGFLNYTKSRVFIQSQLLNQTTLSQKPIQEDLKRNRLHYSNINKSVDNFNKQFSLLDPKVQKNIVQFWKSMRKPLLKVTYSCLHAMKKQEEYTDEINWIMEVDANNGRSWSYNQTDTSKQNKMQQEKDSKGANKFFKNRRLSTQNKQKSRNNTSLSRSRSMLSNSIYGLEKGENVMGILNFVEIVNDAVEIDGVLRYFSDKVNNIDNQYWILLIHDPSSRTSNPKPVFSNLYLENQLSGIFWLLHSSKSKQPTVLMPQEIVLQAHVRQVAAHLSGIYQKKLSNVNRLIQDYHKNQVQSKYIPKGVIGKNYLPEIGKKNQQLKDIIIEKKEDRASKKEVYENCKLQIETLINKIEESQGIFAANTIKISQWEQQLTIVQIKINHYTGLSEFEAAKKRLMEIPRKSIQKQLLKAAYIEDNPLNLSFIYRFNVLADNSYFPDKNFEVYQQHFSYQGKYPIFDEQKKQFVKLINMGRLNVMLQNQDYCPSEDQATSAEKVRRQFKYFGPINLTTDNQKISEAYPFTLNSLLIKQQLKFIQLNYESPIHQAFHSYIAMLSAHSFTHQSLENEKSKLQKNLKSTQEESKIMVNKIRDCKFVLKQQQEKLSAYKSKYEKSIEDVEVSEENEKIFLQIAKKNTDTLIKIFEANVFGVHGQQMLSCQKQIATFLVYELSQSCQQCRCRNQNRKEGKMQPFHPLSIKSRRYLFYLLGIQAVKSQILDFKVENINDLYFSMYQYLLKSCLHIEFVSYQCSKLQKQLPKVDHRNHRITKHSESLAALSLQQMEQIIARQIFPEFAQEHGLLLRKLDRMEELLDGCMLKFVEKIDLIQARDVNSIRKWQISEQIIDAILQSYKNQMAQFEGLDFTGDWKRKNNQGFNMCRQIASYINDKNKISDLFSEGVSIPQANISQFYQRQNLSYYIRLLAQTIKRSSHMPVFSNKQDSLLCFVGFIVKQFVYDHSSAHLSNFMQEPIKFSHKLVQQQVLHKIPLQLLEKAAQGQVVNRISLLDSLLSLRQSLLFVEAGQHFEGFLSLKAFRTHSVVIWKNVNNQTNERILKVPKQQKERKISFQQMAPEENSFGDDYKSEQEEQQNSENQKQIEPQPQPEKYTSLDQLYCSQFYHHLDDTTAQHWIVNYLAPNTFHSYIYLKQSVDMLNEHIKKIRQQNTKYIFIVRNQETIRYIEQNVQPVYRVDAQANVFGWLSLQEPIFEPNQKFEQMNKIKKKSQQQEINKDRSTKQLGTELIGKLFNYFSTVTSKSASSVLLHLFTKNIKPVNQSPSISKIVEQTSQQQLINSQRILYMDQNSLRLLFKYLHHNSLMISSSLEYRMLKKLLLFWENDQKQIFQIAKGYEVFGMFFGHRKGQWPYQLVKMAVVGKESSQVNDQDLDDDQILKFKMVKKIRKRFYKFIQFIQTIHNGLYSNNIAKVEPKKQFELPNSQQIKINQDLLSQLRLSENKQRYTAKMKDHSEQILKNLFLRWTASVVNASKQQQKTSLDLKSFSSTNKIEAILTDPKSYIIINKVFKRMMNKVYQRKNNQKNIMSVKQGRIRKKMLLSPKDYQNLCKNQYFRAIWANACSIHRLQFLMWAFSEIENIRLNNIGFIIKPNSNSFEQKVERIQEQRKLKQVFIIEFYNVDKLSFRLDNKNVVDSYNDSTIQFQVQLHPFELNDKISKFYRGLLFKLENEAFDSDQYVRHQKMDNFEQLSIIQEEVFLNNGSKISAENEGSSPGASMRQGQSESASSPLYKGGKKNYEIISPLVSHHLKQVTMIKNTYTVIPMYCRSDQGLIQVGVLQIGSHFCKGFDPLRTFAVIK